MAHRRNALRRSVALNQEREVGARLLRSIPSHRASALGLRDAQGGKVNETIDGLPTTQTDRRGFLRWMTSACVAMSAPPLVLAGGSANAALGFSERRLRLHNINTMEDFDGAYWRDGKYLPDALQTLNVVLRDHRANKITKMDPKLFDALWDVSHGLDADEPFKVVCAYRCRQTNNAKRRVARGVARESYHTRGMAVDVALEGRTLRAVAGEAKALSTGGVGIYNRSGFVHLDVGPVRSW